MVRSRHCIGRDRSSCFRGDCGGAFEADPVKNIGWVRIWRWGAMFRVFGYGLSLERKKSDEGIYFSERHGLRTVWRFWGWKVTPLQPGRIAP